MDRRRVSTIASPSVVAIQSLPSVERDNLIPAGGPSTLLTKCLSGRDEGEPASAGTGFHPQRATPRAAATAVVLTASGFCAAIPTRQLLKLQKQGLQKALERGLAAGKSLAGGDAGTRQQLVVGLFCRGGGVESDQAHGQSGKGGDG
jgi:hypothetical protein